MNNKYAFIFTKNNLPFFRNLKRRFNHVCVLEELFDGMLVFHNVSSKGLNTFYVTGQTMDEFIEQYFIDCVHVKVEAREDRETKFKFFPIIPSCVNICQYITRIKIKALTPYGMYKKLIKMDIKNLYDIGIVSIETNNNVVN